MLSGISTPTLGDREWQINPVAQALSEFALG